jgi:L-lactate dehydrogenase complex protein LldE
MKSTVQLFVTCLVDSLFPEVGEAILEVLNRVGVRVKIAPDQTCCGQPAYNAGFREAARRMAIHTLEVYGKTKGPVLVPSGSCAAMLQHGYLELFAEDPLWYVRAERLASRTYEFSQFLVDVLGIVDLGSNFAGRIAYHPSCHLLRDLDVDQQPWSLLEAVGGAQISKLEPACCGFGGVFAVDHAKISTEMLKRKITEIEELHPQVVVGCDVSCLMQIEGGLRHRGSDIRCAHLAQILAEREVGLR